MTMLALVLDMEIPVITDSDLGSGHFLAKLQ